MRMLIKKEWFCMEQLKEDIGTRKDLCLYRIKTAKDNLRSARILLEAEEYKSANNRAYYAVFHALNAIHALNGNAFKRHKEAIANFNKNNNRWQSIFMHAKPHSFFYWMVLCTPHFCTIPDYLHGNCTSRYMLCQRRRGIECQSQGRKLWLTDVF